jgi:hypothetical protein
MVPIYKKADKTDCSNYRGISMCSGLSYILLSCLTLNEGEINGEHQCEFGCIDRFITSVKLNT